MKKFENIEVKRWDLGDYLCLGEERKLEFE